MASTNGGRPEKTEMKPNAFWPELRKGPAGPVGIEPGAGKGQRLILESIQDARRIQAAMLPNMKALGDRGKGISISAGKPLHLVGGDYLLAFRGAFGEREPVGGGDRLHRTRRARCVHDPGGGPAPWTASFTKSAFLTPSAFSGNWTKWCGPGTAPGPAEFRFGRRPGGGICLLGC